MFMLLKLNASLRTEIEKDTCKVTKCNLDIYLRYHFVSSSGPLKVRGDGGTRDIGLLYILLRRTFFCTFHCVFLTVSIVSCGTNIGSLQVHHSILEHLPLKCPYWFISP